MREVCNISDINEKSNSSEELSDNSQDIEQIFNDNFDILMENKVERRPSSLLFTEKELVGAKQEESLEKTKNIIKEFAEEPLYS